MADLQTRFTADGFLLVEYKQYPDEPGEIWHSLLKLTFIEAVQFAGLLNRAIDNRMLSSLPVKAVVLKTGREI